MASGTVTFVGEEDFATGGGIGVTDGNKGGVTVSGSGTVWSLNAEAIDDRVASLLVAGANVTLTYNDVANTLTIAASGGGGGGGNTYFPGGWT